MEMEHINENLIKVLIDAEDLEKRGINFLDLIGDQQSVERFFYSILEEVDVDHHFRESETVTFQVMPNRDGLELYISRATPDEFMDHWDDGLAERFLAGEANLYSSERYNNAGLGGSPSGQKIRDFIDDALETPVGDYVISFKSLEDFLGAAREINLTGLLNDLYHLDKAYYLVLHLPEKGSELSESDYNNIMSILEYGEKDSFSVNFLQEHAQLLQADDAMNFFGNKF
ncbi:hypothetical protein CL176_03165 [Suicoccus acidiformans]|uniref:Adapter protein MecA n=1 Tax=Suicoccus acidiformans TaxID=2036206 RepID=A0A347WJ51_9LACT|nr:adaptor protein MecA [Suicoccus acidiformans]AXY25108.1 hypothetical protein CL176_03165 [Suicoccus acidiformans]